MAERFQFDETFLQGLQFRLKQDQERDQLKQEIAMKMRQMSLLDKQFQQREAEDKSEFEQNIAFEKPLKEAQADYYKSEAEKNRMPVIPKPIEGLLKSERGGGLINDYYGYEQGENDFVTEVKRREDPTYQKPDKSGGDGKTGKSVDISGEVGGISKIVTLMDNLKSDTEKVQWTDSNGQIISVDKTFLRAQGKQYMNDALSKSGVPLQGDVVTNIREDAAGVFIEDKEDAAKTKLSAFNKLSSKEKEKKILQSISSMKDEGLLNDSQYEALRWWAIMGTR